MAQPNAYAANALLPSNTSATRRSSDQDASPNKRQKTAQQNNDNPIYNVGTVLLHHRGTFVTQVPLVNFQTFAPEKCSELLEISESENYRWIMHSYDASALTYKHDVEHWASWLTHHNPRAIVKGESGDLNRINVALKAAREIKDNDFEDALVDALMLWLRAGQPHGSLNVERLRSRNVSFFENHGCLTHLRLALILYHDTAAVRPEVAFPSEDLQDQLFEPQDQMFYDTFDFDPPYEPEIRDAVTRMALGYFSRSGKGPQDPLKLSADEFCQKYHSHHEKNLPCYRTKKFPGQDSN